MKTSWSRRICFHYSYIFRRRLQGVLIKTNIFVLAIRLQDVFKVFSRRVQDVFKTLCQDIFKTFSRHLKENLQDIFRTSSRRLEGIFKMSSKRLQDLLQKRLQDILKASSRLLNKSSRRFQDIFNMFCYGFFKTFARNIIKLNCLPRSRIYLGHTSEKFMVTVKNL